MQLKERSEVTVLLFLPFPGRPSTRALQIITRLIQLLNHPEPQHPVPGKEAVAELYRKDLKKFNKEAEAFTKKFAESRKVK